MSSGPVDPRVRSVRVEAACIAVRARWMSQSLAAQLLDVSEAEISVALIGEEKNR